MVRDNNRESSEQHGRVSDWSRRNLLKLTGTGAGIAVLGGVSMTGAGQEDDETPTPGDGNETDTGGDRHSLADLVDPVFGYPLASGESDDVDIEHVVDVTVEEGQGTHENFPQEPDEDAPGEFAEAPAEFFFDPVGLHVEPDDLVQFDTIAGLHTVTAFHEKFAEPGLDMPTRVPEGVPGYTSPPVTPGESWVYRFTEKGVYDYFCFPHLGLGMVGRIVVFEPEEDDIDSDEFAAPTAGELFPNDERVLTADQLDPANVVDAGTVAWADLTLEAPETETAPTVQVREHPEYGDILVGPDEMTLYMFDRDTRGEPSSACYDGCAETWPPLTVDDGPVADGCVTADLATFQRETGETQVTAGGWPLYYFAPDERPGDASGQGVNDVWWVLRPDGTPLRSDPTT